MSEDAVREFERLSQEIKEIEVKKLSWERERKRLETEFEELKEKVKSDYGVELSEFGNAIKSLEDEVTEKCKTLRRLIDEFKEKTKE